MITGKFIVAVGILSTVCRSLAGEVTVPFAGEVIVSTPDFTESAEFGLKHLTDGRTDTFTLFGDLQTARLTLQALPGQKIAQLALVQGGYGDWAHPKRLQFCYPDGHSTFHDLALAPGEMQKIALDQSVERLDIQVVECYQLDRQRWGGIAEIGTPGYAPVQLNFKPSGAPLTPGVPRPEFRKHLSKNAQALLLTLDSPVQLRLPVMLSVATSLQYQMPDLELQPGVHTYRLNFSDAEETLPYTLEWYPCHITGIAIGNPALPVEVQLLAVAEETDPAMSNPDWYDFAAFTPPEVTIDGQQYTEGMSYYSMGRFANSTFNGLLTERTDDYYFQTSTFGPSADWRCQKFDIWPDGMSVSPRTPLGDHEPWNMAKPAQENSRDVLQNDWVSSIRTIHDPSGNVIQWKTSILGPGFLLENNRDFRLTSRGGGRPPIRSGAPNEDERRFFLDGLRDGDTPQYPPSLLITADGLYTQEASWAFETLPEPWIIAVWGGMESPNWQGDEAVGVLITADRGTIRLNADGLHLSGGAYGISTQFLGLLQPGWELEKVRTRARQLTGMLRNYPIALKEFFRVEADKVAIYNQFEYCKWGAPEYQAKDYAPIPPIYGYGYDEFQLGEFPVNPKNRFETPVGPYHWVDGNQLVYSLPRFPSEFRLYPQVPEGAIWYEKLQKFYDEYPEGDADYIFPGDAWMTPWRPFYWAQGIQGANLVDANSRRRLLDAGRNAVDATFNAVCFYPRQERFSGRQYLASLWVDDKVSPVIFGDINTAVGYSAYALYSYAKFSGDWARVRKYWPRQMQIMRYAELFNDWAVPLTSARENAHFSGIDMDSIVYAGMCAAEKMAREIGETKDADRLAYLRAKIAPATALRLPFRDYFDARDQAPNLFVQGFAEEGPNLFRATPQNRSWLNLSPTLLSWLGPQPEIFSMLNQALGPEFMRKYHQMLFEESLTGENFDGWRKNNDWISASSAVVLANRVEIDWPRQQLLRDFEIYMAHYPWQAWHGTAYLLGALFAKPHGIALIDWDPAALHTLSYDPQQKRLFLGLKGATPFTLIVESATAPTALTVDGKACALTVSRQGLNQWRITLPAVNEEVILDYGER